MHIVNIITEVRHEFDRAADKNKPMNSHHEAKAVIEEELDEYWDEVKTNVKHGYKGAMPVTPDDVVDLETRRQLAMRKELIQTAAMCLRALHDLC